MTKSSTQRHPPSMDAPVVVSFGEILWDCFPDQQLLGGAPVNVAYHLNQQGANALVVSAVGADELGKRAVARINEWKLSADFVGKNTDLATGTVLVDINDPLHPRYTISTDAAWDRIPVTAETLTLAGKARAVIFGSLAQRSHLNWNTLDALLAVTRGLRVFDVNFRPPFVNLERVNQLCLIADIIKLNEDELRQITCSSGTPEEAARDMGRRYPHAVFWITCGAQGAGILQRGCWRWRPGTPVKVRDTVGCGDAFLAAAVAAVLRNSNMPPTRLLQEACSAAEWVARHDGATPPVRPSGD